MIIESPNKVSPPCSLIPTGSELLSSTPPTPGASQHENISSAINTPSLSQHELHRCIARMRWDNNTGQRIVYPPLTSVSDLPAWLQSIEAKLAEYGRDIPRTQWSDAAILFLEGPLNMAMRQQRKARRDMSALVWRWEEFCAALREALVEIDSRPSAIQRFREEHPIATTTAKVAAGTGLVVAGSAVLAPALVVGGLNAIGFTAGGVAGGSIATGIQSVIYGSATTGLFSICQSIGATAVAPALGSMISAAGTIIAGATLIGSRGEGGQTSYSERSPTSEESNLSSSPPPYHA